MPLPASAALQTPEELGKNVYNTLFTKINQIHGMVYFSCSTEVMKYRPQKASLHNKDIASREPRSRQSHFYQHLPELMRVTSSETTTCISGRVSGSCAQQRSSKSHKGSENQFFQITPPGRLGLFLSITAKYKLRQPVLHIISAWGTHKEQHEDPCVSEQKASRRLNIPGCSSKRHKHQLPYFVNYFHSWAQAQTIEYHHLK